MQHWIDRSGIAHWLGLTPEEAAEEKRQSARARHSGDGELTAFNAACEAAKALGRPNSEVQTTVTVLLDWARETHREWFNRCEAPAWPGPGEAAVAPDSPPEIDEGPPLRGMQRPSRQRPGCPEHPAPSEPCIFAC
jgi:hypothetical protein